jgi:hypothetical protein
MIDLSQRFWSEADLAADDWWTTKDFFKENSLNEVEPEDE